MPTQTFRLTEQVVFAEKELLYDIAKFLPRDGRTI